MTADHPAAVIYDILLTIDFPFKTKKFISIYFNLARAAIVFSGQRVTYLDLALKKRNNCL